MAGNIGVAVGDKLEIILTFRAGKEEYSKTYTLSEVKAMTAGGAAPFASELGCALCCSQKAGTAACIARCLVDGQCCDGGTQNCQQLP